MNPTYRGLRRAAVPHTAGVLLAAVAGLSACSRQDIPLVAESREGMFYTHFAEAQQVAQAEGKHILLDFWRPG